MGDLAAEIAERSLTLSIPPFFEVPERLPHMANETTTMVRHALDAFVNADVDSARRVIAADDAVDEDNVQLITAITETMKHQPTLIDAGISMFSVVRHLERIADHATNIAEDVIYLVEGAMVRHAQPGGSVPPPETA
jgi:phosphate transport system protein